MKTLFVIDCHADGRDALGLLLASRTPALEIAAVTSCYCEGADLDTASLERLCRSLSIDAEIGAGSAVPVVYKRSSEDSAPFPTAPARTTSPKQSYAWDLLYRQAKANPKGISILAFGPLTNIAIAIFKYEDFAASINQIIIGGGSSAYGDVTPFAESHAYQDAYAWRAVAQSGIPVTMVGLNAAQSIEPCADEVEALLPSLSGNCWAYPLKRWREKGLGLPLDLAAAAVAASPETATLEHFHVAIETVSTAMYGRTLVDWRFYLPDEKETLVATAMHKDNVLNLLSAQ